MYTQLEGFVDWPIELGGELIHGKGTYLDKYVDKHKWEKIQVCNNYNINYNVSQLFFRFSML